MKLREPIGSSLLFCIATSLLVLTPIFRGGNRYAVLLLIEWLGLALLVVAFCAIPGNRERIWPRHAFLLALCPVLLGIAQLIPVPFSIWSGLPGRQAYAEALDLAGLSGPSPRQISLLPTDTQASILAAIPACAMFMAVQICAKRTAFRLLQVAMWVSVVEAILGLLQAGKLRMLYFGAEFAGSAIGTLANSNHFANLLAMMLPFALLYARARQPLERAYIGSAAKGGSHRKSRQGTSLLLAVVPVLLLGGIIVSRSRMGFATAIVGATLAIGLILVVFRHTGRWKTVLVAVALVFGGLLVLALGIQQLAGRLGMSGVLADVALRLDLMTSSLTALGQYWPLGSGLGTFRGAYLRFQPASVEGLVEYAHNDYLHFVLEGGVAAVVVLAFGVHILARRAVGLFRRFSRRNEVESVLSAICGFGLLAILLHSLVEFPMHIPSNAVFAALLAGIYLRSDHNGKGASTTVSRGAAVSEDDARLQ